MTDWRIEGIELSTRTSSAAIANQAGQAARAARDESLVTVLSIDGHQVAAIVPLDDHGYPIAMGALEVALAAVDRMQDDYRASMPDGTLGDFAHGGELRALRALAETVRRVTEAGRAGKLPNPVPAPADG